MTAPAELEFASAPGEAPSTVLPALRELWLEEVQGARYDISAGVGRLKDARADISRGIARLKAARDGLADIDAAIAATPQGDPTP